ncbi:MAG: hypothetical protein QOC72_3859 [Methylobacteriaceae bacterium]|jgi:hypothetical protein|nr:hypothetical protein [Methylobacteriaceae bacterium]
MKLSDRARGCQPFFAFVLSCAIAGSAPRAEAQKADTAAEVQAVSNALNTFYKATKKPDVGDLIARWERLASTDQPPALPPMLGFLAAYFEKNPAQADRVANHPFARKGQTVVLISLEAAGNDAAARRAAGKWHWSDADAAKLGEIKPLAQLLPETPSDLDTLWGAAFATGDPAYVRKIYDFYGAVANDPKVEFADIVLVIQARRNNKMDSLRGIGERYSPEMAQKIVFAASAIWSLMANATAHPFVKAELDRFEKEAAGTNAVKAMVALRQPQ